MLELHIQLRGQVQDMIVDVALKVAVGRIEDLAEVVSHGRNELYRKAIRTMLAMRNE